MYKYYQYRNRQRRHRLQREVIIVINIKGNVDTTEVGIFFEELADGGSVIDISSLSSSARERVAEAVFAYLDQNFEVLR